MFIVFGVGRWGEEEMKCDDARRDKSRLYKDGRHWGTMMFIKPYAPVETSIYRVSENNGNSKGRRFIASRKTMVIPKDVSFSKGRSAVAAVGLMTNSWFVYGNSCLLFLALGGGVKSK